MCEEGSRLGKGGGSSCSSVKAAGSRKRRWRASKSKADPTTFLWLSASVAALPLVGLPSPAVPSECREKLQGYLTSSPADARNLREYLASKQCRVVSCMQAEKYRQLWGDRAPCVKGGGMLPSGLVTEIHAAPRHGRMPPS